MKLQKIQTALTSSLLSAALALSCVLAAYADDVDIYLQQAPEAQPTPLVILTLDLDLSLGNLGEGVINNLTDTVCSIDLTNLGANPACALLEEAAVLPVLDGITGLTDSLLGEESLVGGLLGLVGPLTGSALSTLTGELTSIIGTDSITGNIVDLTRLDIVALVLNRLVNQLVGIDLAVVVSHADTCEQADFDAAEPAFRRNTTGCSNGGYFLLERTPLEVPEDANAAVDTILSRLGGFAPQIPELDGTDDLAPGLFPPLQAKEMYFEIFRYLTDGDVFNAPLDAEDTLQGAQDLSSLGDSYTSPLDETVCQDIHVVNIFFNNPDRTRDPNDPSTLIDDDSDDAIRAELPGVDLDPTDGVLTFSEMARYLEQDGFRYNGVTYRIKSRYLLNGIDGGGVSTLLDNAVNTAVTFPIGLNPLALPFVTKENFQPVNVTSASFGGPQPVFNRSNLSQAADSLFYGQFLPDADGQAAWRGNLKKLALTDADDGFAVVDSLGSLAIGPDGDIRPSALTFWTVPADLPPPGEDEINGRDGGATDRGGAGMFLIPPRTEPTETNNPSAIGTGTGTGGSAGPRIFYQTATQASGAPLAALNLNNSTVNEANGALAGDALRAAELIAYARGYDTQTENEEERSGLLGFLGDAVPNVTNLIENVVGDLLGGVFCNNILGFLGIILGTSCDVPPAGDIDSQQWNMGAILHSDPLAIDYGGDVRIFAGSNRGFLHQIRDSASTGSTFAGQEVWRMAPRAMLANFDEWSSGESAAGNRPVYGVDGAPVAWIQDFDGQINAADGDHAYLYFGLRRGGKRYYAVDVTNPDAAPTWLWSINKSGNASGDFAELGLTFSTPQRGRILQLDSEGDPVSRTVLVFGGGYNGGNSGGNELGKDRDSGSTDTLGRDDTEGNAIFIVDAETGALIWKARKGASAAGATSASGASIWEHPDFDDSIPSDVTALDTTGDGFLDRLYVGDTGGRLWRADIGAINPDDWRAAPIANLGRHASGGNNVASDRRFFARPDVVRVNNGVNGFFAVIAGTGNRADPLNRGTTNSLYVVKDRGNLDTTASAEPTTDAQLADFSENCAAGGDCDNLLNSESAAFGWKIELGSPADSDRQGEKAFSSPLTLNATVLFTSFVPPSLDINACTPQEGTGRLYAINLLDGTGVVELFSQDGEPSDGVHIDYARGTPLTTAGIPAGVQYIRPQTILSSDSSFTNVDHKTTFRTYWRERDGEN